MKKKIIVLIVAALLVGGGCFVAYKKGLFRGGSKSVDNSAEVYVMTLDEIMGANSSYSSDVFMGVVEGQETSSVTKSTERELDTIFVSEGDTVEKGTPLFSYKIDNLEAENVQYGFDIEGYNLSIQEYNDDITKKQKELDKITGDTDEDKDKKEALANEIAGLNTDIQIAQNNIDQTNAKIEENNRKINNSVVKSSVSGVVTKIADDTNPYTTDGSFITILGASEMRIKGQINEQNVWAINVDEPVTLRSRVDASQTWTGTITKIDTESKQENTDSMYSYGGSSENSSTKYPFYVTIDDSEGLMMGQHVYIELGKTDAPEMDFSDGTYIYEYYISYEEDGTPFLWVEDGNRLAKQTIELGDYYEEQMVYAVTGTQWMITKKE